MVLERLAMITVEKIYMSASTWIYWTGRMIVRGGDCFGLVLAKSMETEY